MSEPRQPRRRAPADIGVDAIPMKGVKPIWYAVAAGCVLVVLGIAVALSIAGNRNGAAHDAAPLNVAPVLENREEAAERRRHLEITQRSLERLKETEEQKKSEDKPPASPAMAAAPAAAPASPATPATAPAEPKPQKRELDKLDNIGSDIAKELGK